MKGFTGTRMKSSIVFFKFSKLELELEQNIDF